MTSQVVVVNYWDKFHRNALVALMNHYAADPAGGGVPLPRAVLAQLPEQLSRIASAFSFLALLDDQAVGLINCFEGFSTFACRPLINVHDLVVHGDYRGRGISQSLLQAVETEAIARGCCKITLEVLEGNHSARRAYRKFGFQGYELDPAMGQAIFLQKKLGVEAD